MTPFQGTKLVFSNEQDDYWWWLMVSGDYNAFRLIEAVIDDPAWKDDAGCEFYQHWDGTKCAQDSQALYDSEKSCWSAGQVNTAGVGRPCQPGVRDCAGLKASCCHVDDRRYGAICTLACNVDADCGDGAWCAPEFNLCLPAVCKAGFSDPNRPMPYEGMGFMCKPANVPTSGLGKTCTLGGKECMGMKAVHCLGDPMNLGGNSTSFCTFECSYDADCGAGAKCIYSEAKPYFCAPMECAAQFANIDFPQWELPDPGFPVCEKP